LSDNRTTAFAKVNICLFLGPVRWDGRHQLVTLFESSDLSDELVITPTAAGSDEVICAGVAGPNLVSEALAALRASGWRAPAVRVEIAKRIPVAAGLGGGSADAAALLRYADRLAPVPTPDLEAIAARLGADVPSQLHPGPSIGTGAGEVIELAPELEDHALLILPQAFGLATAEVYREADRLDLPRPADELAALRSELEAAVRAGRDTPRPLPARLVVNDLQPAALSLRPELAAALERALQAGADQALVCGSGPTVIGIFWGRDALDRAHTAAKRLRSRYPGAIATEVVGRGLLARAPNE
jgi:4-diphosphocytidyl-2-C-methyl-D-erythritol kinase